jgi:hypothetical protein
MGTVFRDDSPERMTEVDILTAFWDDSPEGMTKVEMGTVFWDDSPEETTTGELSIGFVGRSADGRKGAPTRDLGWLGALKLVYAILDRS